MHDVARAAGVHQTTVSLALRNHRSLPLATRTRIQAVADKLGYRPNPFVSAWVSSRRRSKQGMYQPILAYVETYFPGAQPYFDELQRGAAQRAEELGYRLDPFQLGKGGVTSAQLDRILLARGIHGMLIAPRTSGAELLELSLDRRAAVGLGLSLKEPFIERVSNDHFLSTRMAFAKCRELGCRRIGFMNSLTHSERLEHRYLSGYLLAQTLLPDSEGHLTPLLYKDDVPKAKKTEVIERWIRRERPDVVLLGQSSDFGLVAVTLKRYSHVKLVLINAPERRESTAGIYENPRHLGEIGIELLVGKLHRNEYGALSHPQCHLVCGEWFDRTTSMV